MKSRILHSTSRFMLMLLVVQTFNLSINSIEFYRSDRERGSMEQNDYVDSVIEYLVENVMNFSKYTFHAKASMSNNSKQHAASHVVLKWLPDSFIVLNTPVIPRKSVRFTSRNENLISLYFREVPAKPPQKLSFC